MMKVSMKVSNVDKVSMILSITAPLHLEKEGLSVPHVTLPM